MALQTKKAAPQAGKAVVKEVRVASDSRIRIASLVSTKTFGRTDAEFAQILTWFMLDKISPDPEGMTQAELNQWRLDQAHDELWRYMRSEARRNRLQQLRAAQASLYEQADSETAL